MGLNRTNNINASKTMGLNRANNINQSTNIPIDYTGY
jgi:hypothetical protein